jgi:antitoxin component YwqK of YwqJK toxin-antitoxin module
MNDTIVKNDYIVNIDKEYSYELFNKYGIKDGDYQLLVNNQKIIEGKYCNNLRCGNWISDYPNEKIYIVSFFRNDILDEERFFDINTKEPYSGKLVLTVNGSKLVIKIKKGLRNGKSFIYNKEGKVILEENYKDGQKI